MVSRNVYHTTLKELVFLDLLPPEYLQAISRSNLHRWRNENIQRYVGSELNHIANNHADLIKTLNTYPKMFYAYGRLVTTLAEIVGTAEQFSTLLREHKEKVVNVILKAKHTIPVQKAVKLFHISPSTFYAWCLEVKVKCEHSYFKKCTRVYANQLIPAEVRQIKKALTHPKTLHWSIRSIYFKGIRDKSLSVSLNTMYRINRLLGIRKTKDRVRKKKHPKGIRATAPNAIWHADVTSIKTLDGQRHFIYLLLDNYSRYILSHWVTDAISGLIRTETIEEAYYKASKIQSNLNVDLIVDGGPENNNIHVDRFINRSAVNIKKLVALRDIQYSNSMIERANRTLKYRYLHPRQIRDKKHLERTLSYFIKDYNTIKPHGSLEGLTPKEAWEGYSLPSTFRTDVLKQARVKRLAYNKAHRCQKCEVK